MKSYLVDRTQEVAIRNGNIIYKSNTSQVTMDVPQGNVLRPLLFIIFINNIVDCFDDSFVALFADDTSAAVSAPDMTELSFYATVAVHKMETFCSGNGLLLNNSKTEILCFSSKETKLKYSR